MTVETFSRKYRGSPGATHRKFRWDAKRLARKGWKPVSQRYEEGSWGLLAFLIALLLCIVLIGILVFIYMIIVKPKGKGALYVTYERTLEEDNEDWEDEDDAEEDPRGAQDALKTCPDCAETVKEEARVCRYCSYRFE